MNAENHSTSSSLSPAQTALIDAVCDRFERGWSGARPPDIEDFLEEVEPLVRPALLQELLLREVELRRRAGQTPMLEEYQGRFPEQAHRLADLFRRSPSLGDCAAPHSALSPSS